MSVCLMLCLPGVILLMGKFFSGSQSSLYLLFKWTCLSVLEGTASPDVPDLRGLRLHPVPDVPWQQDVCVS